MTTTTADCSLPSCMSRAAVTLVRAMTDPTERSIPPEMTATACATAASATGKAAIASERRPKLP
jgi:hypothetical protein